MKYISRRCRYFGLKKRSCLQWAMSSKQFDIHQKAIEVGYWWGCWMPWLPGYYAPTTVPYFNAGSGSVSNEWSHLVGQGKVQLDSTGNTIFKHCFICIEHTLFKRILSLHPPPLPFMTLCRMHSRKTRWWNSRRWQWRWDGNWGKKEKARCSYSPCLGLRATLLKHGNSPL